MLLEYSDFQALVDIAYEAALADPDALYRWGHSQPVMRKVLGLHTHAQILAAIKQTFENGYILSL